jgi:DNA polymerase
LQNELDEILKSTINYLENVPVNLRIQHSFPVKKEPESKPVKKTLSLNTDEQKVVYKDREELKPDKIVDLFGNVVYEKENWEYTSNIDELYSLICTCQKCRLCSTRTNFVFGVGNPNADVVLIGEAPGADEDAKGEPFVGRAGQLLNKILSSIGFEREEVYICNILKCRPPGNRNPMPDEIENCEPYLKQQLKILKPKLILCLGKFAAETLLKTKLPLNKFRGKVHYYNGIKTMVTFHPAALLRNPQWKRPTWEDMQAFKELYDELK